MNASVRRCRSGARFVRAVAASVILVSTGCGEFGADGEQRDRPGATDSPSPDASASSDQSSDATSSQRLVLEAIRCLWEDGTTVVRDVVIEGGIIAALEAPGTGSRRATDRIIRGEGRTAVIGRRVLLESDPSAADLRLLLVRGFTTVTLPPSPGSACLAELSQIPSMRLPRILTGLEANADPVRLRPTRSGEGAEAGVAVGITIGARAELLIFDGASDSEIRTALANGADPAALTRLRWVITPDPEGPGSPARILYPGELGMLPPLLDRLARAIAVSEVEGSIAAKILEPGIDQQRGGAALSSASTPTSTGASVVGSPGILTVDGLPRGLVWSWVPAPNDETATFVTLIRMVEPLDLWACVTEVESGDGILRQVSLTILDDRSVPVEPAGDFWSRVQPEHLKRSRLDFDALGVELWRVSDTTDADWIRVGELPVTAAPLVLVGSVPTDRSARSAASLRTRGDETRVDLIALGIDPLRRELSIVPMVLSADDQVVCGAGWPLVAPSADTLAIGRWNGMRLSDPGEGNRQIDSAGWRFEGRGMTLWASPADPHGSVRPWIYRWIADDGVIALSSPPGHDQIDHRDRD